MARAAPAGRVRQRDVVERDAGALAGRDVADREAHVLPLVAGVVEVARHVVEADLRAGRIRRQRPRHVRRRVLPDEAADRVGGAGRAWARVDVGAHCRLVEGEEDRVVRGRGGGAVVGRVPLAVDGGVLHRHRVLPPGVAVVVRHGGAEVDQRLEVDEVVVALVVDRDVRVTAAGRAVGTQADGAVDVELEPVVGRAVDERLLRGDPPRAALPVGVALRVEEVERLALGALRVDDGRRAEDELARDVARGRRAAGAAGARAGRDRGNGRVARRECSGVAVGRGEHAARERTDLGVPDARREVRALVDDLLRTGERVAVGLQGAARVVQLEGDVVGRDGRGGGDGDRRLAGDDRDRVHRATRRWRDAAAERATVRAGVADEEQTRGDEPDEGKQSQAHRALLVRTRELGVIELRNNRLF
jgi:hypothetical protein